MCRLDLQVFTESDTDQTGQEICPTQWWPNFDQIYGRHGVDPSFSCLVRAELIFPYRVCQLDLESGQLAIWQYGFVVQCCGWMVLDMHMTIFGRDHPNSSSEGGGGNSGGGGRGGSVEITIYVGRVGGRYLLSCGTVSCYCASTAQLECAQMCSK